MSLNKTVTDSFRFVDKYGMILRQVPPDMGRGDSIKHTFEAWYAYRDEGLATGLKNLCYIPMDRLIKEYMLRHPERLDDTISRDHVTFVLIFLKLMKLDDMLDFEIGTMPWKISDHFSQTIDFWLWQRVLIGRKKFEYLYYPVMWVMMGATSIWNNLVNLIAGYNREFHQKDFIPNQNKYLTKWQLTLKGLRMPMFTIYYHAWQVWALPDCVGKTVLKALMWPLIYRHNYVLKMLLNHPIKPRKEDVMNYVSMNSARWATILNETDTWESHAIPYEEYNLIDRDLLRKLWNEQ
jgi:hypothetical protein